MPVAIREYRLEDAGPVVALSLRAWTPVFVDTGGGDGHAPARRVYEKADYTPLPVARYLKAL